VVSGGKRREGEKKGRTAPRFLPSARSRPKPMWSAPSSENPVSALTIERSFQVRACVHRNSQFRRERKKREREKAHLGLLPPVRVRLPNQHHLRQPRLIHRLPRLVVVIRVAQQEPKHRISRLQDRTEMRPRLEDRVARHVAADGGNLLVGVEETTALGRLGRVRSRLNVENDELDRLSDVGEGRERTTPVNVRRDVGHVERDGVDEVDLVANSVADDKLRDVREGAGDLERDADDVVLTDGDDFDRERLLLVSRGVLLVDGNELLRHLRPVRGSG
jgi:hypothetical protein